MTDALSNPDRTSFTGGARLGLRRPVRLLLALCSAALAACGGGDGGDTKPVVRPATVASVLISPAASTVDTGKTVQLAAFVRDGSGAAVTGKTITWVSSVPTVATVSPAGLVTAITAGTVTISASTDGVTGTGTVVSTVPVSARCDASTVITLGQTVTGTLLDTDCRLNDNSYVDKYVLTLTEDTPVRISMTSALVDSYLILQDFTTGAIVAENDDGNGDTGSRIEQLVPAGKYVIGANSFDANQFGDYKLTVERAASACLASTPISTPSTVNGNLAATACLLPDSSYTDRYRLTVASSTIVTATMRSSAIDSYLFIENTNGTSIGRNDNSSIGTRDALVSATLDPGTYIINANSALPREVGAYTLTLSSRIDPCGVSRVVTVGSTTSDTLSSSACKLSDGSYVRRYGFSLATSTALRIDLTSTQFDPYLFVQQAGSAPKLAEDDDSGPGLNAQVLQVFAPGEYVVTVTSATVGESGAFELAIAGPASAGVGLTVTPPTATLLPGQTQQLTAAVTGATNTNVAWKSSAPGIASVGATGIVRAITAGAATITVTAAADPARTATSEITVNAGTDVNLDVPLVYLTQSAQTPDGRIPLVADRPTVARVFVRGSRSGLGNAAVRLRVFNGATVTGTLTGTATIAVATDEGCCSADIPVPASLIRDGMTIVADVDPNNAIAESNETDNAWPLTGVSKPIRVVTVPPINIQLVPIRHRVASTVSAPTTRLTELLQRMYPLSAVNVTIHAEYATDTPAPSSSDTWVDMLRQMDVLRAAESSNNYYYGVLAQQAAPGIIGIAGVTGFTGVGISGPDSLAAETLTHEFGHSFGRQHSPTPSTCGTPANVDANFPRSDGTIGIVGFDVAANAIYRADRFDVMGYCNKSWASEYTYQGILAYLRSGVIPLAVATQAEVPALMISGSLVGGAVTLDPVFTITTKATAQRASGRFVAEGTSADGRVLFRHRFDGYAMSDVDAATRTFVALVPYDASVSGAVANITVRDESGGGRSGVLLRAGSYAASPSGVSLRVDADPQLVVRAAGTNRYDVTWNTSRYPSIIVRDKSTRRVVGIGRRGALTINAASLNALEVLLSDGVGSSTRALSVGGAP